MRFLVRRPALFIISLSVAALLTGCAPGKEVEPVEVYYMPVPPPPTQDILELGRGMSHNTVDIYEPGVTAFDVKPVETFKPRPLPVPKNPNFIVRDPSVTAYSLDSFPVEPNEDYPSPFNPDGSLR